MRGIEETGGLTEEARHSALPRRLYTKQVRRKIKVYAPELQSKLISGGKLRELAGGQRDLLDYSGDRLEQFRIPTRLHQSFSYPKQIVLEHDGHLRAAFESSNHLAIHLRESLGKGHCLARRKPISREQTSVASKEFLICWCSGSHGEVPRFPEKFSRISMLPWQGQTYFCGNGDYKERRPEYSVQHMVRILVVGG